MARVFAAIATLIAVTLIAPLPSAAADGYGPQVPTAVAIEVDDEIRVGDDVVITYSVRANSDEGPIEGTLAINGAPGSSDAADRTFAQTRDYADTPITVNLGSQPIGDYTTSASFTPDAGSVYLPSTGTATYRVVGGRTGGPGDDGAGGILPNTGGPAVWWLLLGSLLVAGGAGVVHAGRRRSVASA
ncbi:LPXTG cell wall anchor domain-containing protein [Nocardioides panacisoli]|uniref:LPXTG cell wall anchor domain-containing protein n=1 Tax=Nocardioides panacisoli TaxID=627624 RepID=UPI001C62B5F4|nr:LPXTG cell wall anchor domain-containing protein [Nocardioides panacisoli]QYJ04383.1 LPXTG cell wall anchor domain-containing protein [Nocardioides panacisoli]